MCLCMIAVWRWHITLLVCETLYVHNQPTTTTTILQPLYRSTCVSRHLQSRTGGFCRCKVLLPAGRSWWLWSWYCIFITHTHTHTHPFNGPFSGTTWVSQYQKGKTNLEFTEARDSEWQWHHLGHMQVSVTEWLARLTAVWEDPGSNHAADSKCLSRQLLWYTVSSTGCAPLLQCLGLLSLPPFVGR